MCHRTRKIRRKIKSQPAESGLRARLQALLHSLQPRQATKADLTKDRTRSLALLIGGTVGAVLLFIGVFSTSPRSPQQESAVRNAPNLGRPALGNQSKPVQGSVTPLLNADVQSTDGASDQLSPADIRGTSRRSSDANEGDTDGQSTNVNVSAVPRVVERATLNARIPLLPIVLIHWHRTE